MTSVILGILGGGQLGRMLALAAAPLDVRCRVLDPTPDPPAAVAAEVLTASYSDVGALEALSRDLDALTFEFENVPVKCLAHLEGRVPIRPGAASLRATQDRLVEKTLLRSLGIATAPFTPVDDRAGLEAAVAAVGLPALLKTRRLGYDGRGQHVIPAGAGTAALDDAWAAVAGVPCILEGRVDFARELATLAVRGLDGEVRCWPVVETRQRAGMLRAAIAPAPTLDPRLATTMLAAHRILLQHLDHVGALAVEWFETPDGPIANEIAPRVHNSGHWTIEGAATSQFANHVRAVCALPLGDTTSFGHAGTVNLVGVLPDLRALLRTGARVHLYGKAERPGRKLGHATVIATTAQERDAALAGVEALVA